jgi:chloramphenicol-sensitive protein RarD
MFPAFFGLLAFAGPVEIVAHRIFWTLVLLMVILAVTRKFPTLRGFDRRTWTLVAAGAVSISLNWGIYVYAVLSGHVAEAALGYFINPLVSVAIGVIVFKERLTLVGRCALVLAVVAVVVLTVAYHRVPYIALGLACSFAAYGVVKKLQPLPPTISLTAETVAVAPVALGYLGWLALFTSDADRTPMQWALLAISGPMTAVPLMLFGAAAHRLPVVSIGVLQYLTPILQFLWAVAVRRETLSATGWLGFGLVWIALAVFTADAIYRAVGGSVRSRVGEDAGCLGSEAELIDAPSAHGLTDCDPDRGSGKPNEGH